MESSSAPCTGTDAEPDQTSIHGASNTPSLQQLLGESPPLQNVVIHVGFSDLLYAFKETIMPGGSTGSAAGGKAVMSDTPVKGVDVETSKGARPKEGTD